MVVYDFIAKPDLGQRLQAKLREFDTYVWGLIVCILAPLVFHGAMVNVYHSWATRVWPLRQAMFPEVGVSIGELDQAGALIVGIITLLFSLRKSFSSGGKIGTCRTNWGVCENYSSYLDLHQ